jgi:hypothetical protein
MRFPDKTTRNICNNLQLEHSSMFEKCENFGRVLEMIFVRRNFFLLVIIR